MSRKRYPFSIMWYEGMPLDPAIFQQEYLHLMDTLAYAIENISPNNWGVTKLTLDEEHLAEGIFAIKELECLMPDYYPIIFYADGSSEESNSLAINLNDYKNEFKNQDLFIFLTLPNNHLSYNANTSKARYKSYEVENVKDLNNGDNESKISFLKPAFELILSEIPTIGSVSIPLAKIKFTGLNFQLAQYAPPTLKISSSPLLMANIEKLIKSGREKLKYLTNKPDDSLENKFLITNLANICLSIENSLKNNESPYQIFVNLINAISSALILFKEIDKIPIVPVYNHLDHLSSIMPLIEYINRAMDNIKESYKREEFKEQEGIFGLIIPFELANAESITIGISKKANNTLDEAIIWIQNAIITTQDKLTKMQDQRIIGATRNIIKYSNTLDLKETPNMILAQIMLDKSYITPNNMLCIMNFNNNTPEKIYLFTPSK